jgi:hypothetical protein
MEARERLGVDSAMAPAPVVMHRLDNPDDQLAFFEENSIELAADAWSGFQRYGRGMVILREPRDRSPIVEAWYETPETDEHESFGRPFEARQDLEGYDPETEILLGVTDHGRTYLRFWRATLPIAPPGASALVQQRLQERREAFQCAAEPQPGPSFTPAARRRFWEDWELPA